MSRRDWLKHLGFTQTPSTMSIKPKEIQLTCMVCGEKFMGPEPLMCCSGRDCGCMGLPTEPIVCSKECSTAELYAIFKQQKEK